MKKQKTIEHLLADFDHQTKIKKHLKQMLKIRIYKRITGGALPIFLKGGERFVAGPQVCGVYEPKIKSLIEYAAENGFSDFLVDVGANLGLISCQSGDFFSEVHLFEPNPYVIPILGVNIKIMLKKASHTIHEYALGAKESVLTLSVPKTFDWGAAFIKTPDNFYSESTLAAKDAYDQFDPDLYSSVPITVKSAEEEFRQLFELFIQKQYRKGVIKIDVEGFEPIVLKAIQKTIPKDFEIVIVFENWQEGTLSDFIDLEMPHHRVSSYVLVTDDKPLGTLSGWLHLLSKWLLKGGFSSTLLPLAGKVPKGDCVLTFLKR